MHFFFSGPRIMGVRPGIVLGPEDFLRFRRPSAVQGAFLYVIQGAPGLIKIGVTKDPRGRMASLQTASPFPLSFAAIAATPGSGFDIEERAHGMLSNRRVLGEWFRASPLTGINALTQAAQELQEPLLCVSPEQADIILAAAAGAPAGTRRPPGPARPPYLPLAWEKPLMIALAIMTPIVVLLMVGLP